MKVVRHKFPLLPRWKAKSVTSVFFCKVGESLLKLRIESQKPEQISLGLRDLFCMITAE